MVHVKLIFNQLHSNKLRVLDKEQSDLGTVCAITFRN